MIINQNIHQMDKLIPISVGFIMGCFITKHIIKSDIRTHYVQSTELNEYLISSIITSECNNCSDKIKYLIGQTVLNRADNNNTTILKEIYKPEQYYYKCNFHLTAANNLIAHNIINNCIPEGYKNTKVTHFYDSSAEFQEWMLSMEVIYFDDNLIIGYLNK